MKLLEVWVSRNAWKDLSELKKPPKVAYLLMKYWKDLMEEVQLIDDQRNQYIREAMRVGPDKQVTIQPGTDEHKKFVSKFTEFLETESDLAPVEISLEDLISALDSESGNVLSEKDLADLEPFFKEE